MTAGIGPAPRPSDPDPLRETAGRRIAMANQAEFQEIQVELEEIDRFLKQNRLDDAKTQEIVEWHRLFKKGLTTTADPRLLRNTFIERLQDILRDPMDIPLDEKSYLCSDGETYGHKTYRLYVHSVSGPVPFVEPPPHPVARRMVEWLKKHDALLFSDEQDQLYEALMEQIAQAQAPPPALSREEKRRLMRENRAQREALIVEEQKRDLEQFEQRVNQDLEARTQAISQVQQDIQNLEGEVDVRIEQQRRDFQAQRDELAQILDNPPPGPQEFQRQLEDLAGRIESALESQLDVLEEEIPELQRSDEQIKGRLSDLENETKEVRKEIQETKIAIKKAKKARKKQMFKTIAMIGASALATYGLYLAAKEFGLTLTAYASPVKGGGATLNIGWKV